MVEKSKPTAAAERLQSLPKRPGKASFASTILLQSNYPPLKVLLTAEFFNTMLLATSLSCSVHL